MESFVYHYENYCYRVFAFREKLIRFINEILELEYEGHDVMKNSYAHNSKYEDQPEFFPSGRRTQNGLFIDAVKRYKENRDRPEIIKVYEKIMSGVWSLKGYFDLIDYKAIHDGKRNVFRFY